MTVECSGEVLDDAETALDLLEASTDGRVSGGFSSLSSWSARAAALGFSSMLKQVRPDQA